MYVRCIGIYFMWYILSGYCPPATTPTPDSGIVTSPNYPSNYPRNLGKGWPPRSVKNNSTLIQVEAGSRIELNIVDIDIQDWEKLVEGGARVCSNDYIKGVYFTNS